MRRSIPQLLFTTLALGLLLLRQDRIAPLAGIEETFINWLASNTSGAHAEAPVMLIEINDNCMLLYPWPWTPLNYTAFLDAALQLHAPVVAVEPVLLWNGKSETPEQTLLLPEYEKFLHDRILQVPKLELGAQLGFPEDPDVLPPLQPLPVLRNVTGAVDQVPEYTVIESEPGEDIRLTAALGFTNVPPVEPTAEHAPMVFRYRGQMVPSFTLQALMLWYGVLPDEVQVNLGSGIRLGDKLTIPVNAAGAMLVDWQVAYDRAGFDDLTLAIDQIEHKHPPMIDPAKVKDRIMLLARTDDQSQTILFPTGRKGSPGELIAAALATVETRSFARPAGAFGGALVILLAMLFAWCLSTRRKIYVIPYLAGFCAAYLLACLAIFETTRIAFPLTPMLGLALFAAIYRLLAPAAA